MIKTSSQILTPELITFHFLGHFAGKLKVRTLAAHLPVAGNLAPLQSTAAVKGNTISIADAIEKGASELAASVNSQAEAAGATHVSFEELDHPQHIQGWNISTDRETGISVRCMWAIDIAIGSEVTRFDVCYRLWKLLPGAEK